MKLQEKYGERGFAVLAVDCWDDEPVKMIKTFARRSKINYTILPHGSRVASNWGVMALPTNYLIGPNGKIVKKIELISSENLPAVEKLIESTLKQ